MAESIEGHGGAANTSLASISATSASQTWRALLPPSGAPGPVDDPFGAVGVGGTNGIAVVIAGIDPVIQFQLAPRLRNSGQIWPVGFG